MIKGKKANMTLKQIIAIIVVVMMILLISSLLIKNVSRSEKDINATLNIKDYIPQKVFDLFVDDIPDDVKNYFYDFSYQLLYDNPDEKNSQTIGKLVSMSIETFKGKNYAIGFKNLDYNENLIYLSTYQDGKYYLISNNIGVARSTNYLTYKDMLSQADQDDLFSVSYGKKFVVMRNKNDYDAIALLHYITGLDYKSEDLNKADFETTTSRELNIEKILKDYQVNQVAISLRDDDSLDINYDTISGGTTVGSCFISYDKNPVMIYFYKEYVVFFMVDKQSNKNFDLTKDGKLDGLGTLDPDLLEQLTKKSYIIKR